METNRRIGTEEVTECVKRFVDEPGKYLQRMDQKWEKKQNDSDREMNNQGKPTQKESEGNRQRKSNGKSCIGKFHLLAL